MIRRHRALVNLPEGYWVLDLTERGLAEALDVLVAIPRQPGLDFEFAVSREGVGDQSAAARADGEPLDVLLLGDVGSDAERVAAR